LGCRKRRTLDVVHFKQRNDGQFQKRCRDSMENLYERIHRHTSGDSAEPACFASAGLRCCVWFHPERWEAPRRIAMPFGFPLGRIGEPFTWDLLQPGIANKLAGGTEKVNASKLFAFNSLVILVPPNRKVRWNLQNGPNPPPIFSDFLRH
jgi:hypothetical protein